MTSQWARRHILAAPWGTALATWLLTIYYDPEASFAEMVSMGAMIYGMVMSALELGVVPMAFYAYEKIKNDRANLRRQGLVEGIAQGRSEGVAETIEAMRAKFKEDPDLSLEELLDAMMADLQNNGHRNGDKSTNG